MTSPSPERRPNKLQRLLSARLWGKPRRERMLVRLGDLSTTDQHRLLTASAEDTYSVLTHFLAVGQLVVCGLGVGFGNTFRFDTGARFWYMPTSATIPSLIPFAVSLVAWWLLATHIDSLVDRLMRQEQRRSCLVDTGILQPRQKPTISFWYLLLGLMIAAWAVLWLIFGDYSTAAGVVLGVCWFAGCPIAAGWFYAKRIGQEPCCRGCSYALPWTDPLPSNCPECGLELSEPWRRVRGETNPISSRVVLVICVQVLAVLVGMDP